MDWGLVAGGGLAVAGGALTIVGGIVADLMKDRRVDSREAAARAVQKAAERDAFQRETLTGLQDALTEWARALMEAHGLYRKSAHANGSWETRSRLPDELNERMMALQRRVSLLRSRVLDDEERRLVDAATSTAYFAVLGSTEEAAVEAAEQVAPMLVQAIERAGELIRGLW
jgi:hypothetical protein